MFYVLVFWLWGLWDPSSPTRNWTPTSCAGRWSLNHRLPRKSLERAFKLLELHVKRIESNTRWVPAPLLGWSPGAIWDSSWIAILWAETWDFRLGFLRQAVASCLCLSFQKWMSYAVYPPLSDITHIWNLKSNINLFTNQQQTQQTQKTSLPLPKRKGKEG